MNKKLTLLITVAIMLLYACASDTIKNADSVATIKSDKQAMARKKKSAGKLTLSFNEFFERFNRDSVYQKAHVKLPLRMELTDENGDTDSVNYLPESRWKNIKLVNEGTNIFTKEKLDEAHYIIKYQIEDTGFLLYHYFTYENGQWWLASTKDMGD